jgi:Arc/MetJ-type ribon-helix-helix transcriptional regulator
VGKTSRAVRTTVTLPAELRDAVDRAVREGRAKSRNELLVNALRHELIAQERAAIDAAFAALAEDDAFHAESVGIAEEAVPAGWEALQLGEAKE